MKSVAEKIGNFTILKIEQELGIIADSNSLDEELNNLMDKGALNIALDLSGMTYLYSEAVAVFMATSKRLKEIQGFLCLYGVGEEVSSYIETVGLDKIIKIYQRKEDFIKDKIAGY